MNLTKRGSLDTVISNQLDIRVSLTVPNDPLWLAQIEYWLRTWKVKPYFMKNYIFICGRKRVGNVFCWNSGHYDALCKYERRS